MTQLNEFVIAARPEEEHIIVPAVALANRMQALLADEDMQVGATAMSLIVALMADQRHEMPDFLPRAIDYMRKNAETFLAQMGSQKAKQSGQMQ